MFLALALSVAGVALVCTASCLPDLQIDAAQPPRPPGEDRCGDGRIAAEGDAGEQCDPGDAGVAPGCTAQCALDCADGVLDPATNHCYFREKDATFKQAGAACASRGAHIVTFRDGAERQLASSLVSALSWVGLTQEVASGGYAAAAAGEPGFAAECPGCFAPGDGGPFPRSPSAPGNCVADDGRAPSYLLVDCASPLAVVCEREPPGAFGDQCSGGYCVAVPETRGKKRYLYVPVPAAAEEAKGGCEALGGSLVLFDSASEREAVLAELQRLALLRSARLIADEAWVGLAAPGDGGGFLWDDGRAESTRPPLWGVSEPRRAEGRAVVLIVPPTAVTDISVQLARVVDERERRPYLCQY
ncbi:MAG: C-type lectin domain-containing protein [Myxococcales bacterium]|nr:C-type lectin domain-containing protein [Myxococcales bacterium]